MGSLLAGVAHELNNSLSVVPGHTDLLSQLTVGSPLAMRAEKVSNVAERQKVRLNQIIREAVELLAYPLRVDNGQAPAARLRPDPERPPDALA